MTRAENPILLWLIAATQWRAGQLPPDAREYELGVYDTLASYRRLCRWLDAEDLWALNLQYLRDGNKHLDWVMWREARMAEAGVL